MSFRRSFFATDKSPGQEEILFIVYCSLLIEIEVSRSCPLTKFYRFTGRLPFLVYSLKTGDNKHRKWSYNELAIIYRTNNMITKKEDLPHLTKEEIKEGTNKGIEKYENLSFFEEYAMFMGVSQILEFGLKKLLQEKFDYDLEKMEKWTLGRTTNELEKNGLREDFIFLLKSLVEYRNYIAHELLFDDAMVKSLLGKNALEDHYSKSHRTLHKAILELEQIVFLFDWTNSNDGWD